MLINLFITIFIIFFSSIVKGSENDPSEWEKFFKQAEEKSFLSFYKEENKQTQKTIKINSKEEFKDVAEKYLIREKLGDLIKNPIILSSSFIQDLEQELSLYVNLIQNKDNFDKECNEKYIKQEDLIKINLLKEYIQKIYQNTKVYTGCLAELVPLVQPKITCGNVETKDFKLTSASRNKEGELYKNSFKEDFFEVEKLGDKEYINVPSKRGIFNTLGHFIIKNIQLRFDIAIFNEIQKLSFQTSFIKELFDESLFISENLSFELVENFLKSLKVKKREFKKLFFQKLINLMNKNISDIFNNSDYAPIKNDEYGYSSLFFPKIWRNQEMTQKTRVLKAEIQTNLYKTRLYYILSKLNIISSKSLEEEKKKLTTELQNSKDELNESKKKSTNLVDQINNLKTTNNELKKELENKVNEPKNSPTKVEIPPTNTVDNQEYEKLQKENDNSKLTNSLYLEKLKTNKKRLDDLEKKIKENENEISSLQKDKEENLKKIENFNKKLKNLESALRDKDNQINKLKEESYKAKQNLNETAKSGSEIEKREKELLEKYQQLEKNIQVLQQQKELNQQELKTQQNKCNTLEQKIKNLEQKHETELKNKELLLQEQEEKNKILNTQIQQSEEIIFYQNQNLLNLQNNIVFLYKSVEKLQQDLCFERQQNELYEQEKKSLEGLENKLLEQEKLILSFQKSNPESSKPRITVIKSDNKELLKSVSNNKEKFEEIQKRNVELENQLSEKFKSIEKFQEIAKELEKSLQTEKENSHKKEKINKELEEKIKNQTETLNFKLQEINNLQNDLANKNIIIQKLEKETENLKKSALLVEEKLQKLQQDQDNVEKEIKSQSGKSGLLNEEERYKELQKKYLKAQEENKKLVQEGIENLNFSVKTAELNNTLKLENSELEQESNNLESEINSHLVWQEMPISTEIYVPSSQQNKIFSSIKKEEGKEEEDEKKLSEKLIGPSQEKIMPKEELKEQYLELEEEYLKLEEKNKTLRQENYKSFKATLERSYRSLKLFQENRMLNEKVRDLDEKTFSNSPLNEYIADDSEALRLIMLGEENNLNNYEKCGLFLEALKRTNDENLCARAYIGLGRGRYDTNPASWYLKAFYIASDEEIKAIACLELGNLGYEGIYNNENMNQLTWYNLALKKAKSSYLQGKIRQILVKNIDTTSKDKNALENEISPNPSKNDKIHVIGITPKDNQSNDKKAKNYIFMAQKKVESKTEKCKFLLKAINCTNDSNILAEAYIELGRADHEKNPAKWYLKALDIAIDCELKAMVCFELGNSRYICNYYNKNMNEIDWYKNVFIFSKSTILKIKAHIGLGKNAESKGKWKFALKDYKSAFNMVKDVKLGKNYAGELDKAEKIIEEIIEKLSILNQKYSQEIFESIKTLSSLLQNEIPYNLSKDTKIQVKNTEKNNKFNNEEAKKYIFEAKKHIEDNFDEKCKLLKYALSYANDNNILAEAYIELGRAGYKKNPARYYLKALSAKPNDEFKAIACFELGNSGYKGNYNNKDMYKTDWYDQALQLTQSSILKVKIFIELGKIAESKKAISEYKQAKDYYQKAYLIMNNIKPTKSERKDFSNLKKTLKEFMKKVEQELKLNEY